MGIDRFQIGWQQLRKTWTPPVTRVVAAMFVFGAIAAACNSDNSPTGGDSIQTAGDSIQTGSALYTQNCASCHGIDLRGTDDGPSLLSIVYEPNHHGDESFRSAIQNGTVQHHWNFGDMLPIEGLNDAEIDAIISYVREVQDREGFEP